MQRIICKLALAATLAAAGLYGQFNSGSNGSDGALSFATPGTVDFDPVALGKDADGDNIFHFTTINIAAGVTVKLRASKLRNSSVVWLASGPVTIAGTLDLSGGDGGAAANAPHAPAEPGPGGYAGGAGGRVGAAASAGAGPGGGPGGGGGLPGCGGSHGLAAGSCGVAYGNPLLIPLRGGSGGGGGSALSNSPGGNGGAGGGAIQIASSGTITVSGAILADGGAGGVCNGGRVGGGGRGGGYQPQAPAHTGTGLI